MAGLLSTLGGERNIRGGLYIYVMMEEPDMLHMVRGKIAGLRRIMAVKGITGWWRGGSRRDCGREVIMARKGLQQRRWLQCKRLTAYRYICNIFEILGNYLWNEPAGGQ